MNNAPMWLTVLIVVWGCVAVAALLYEWVNEEVQMRDTFIVEYMVGMNDEDGRMYWTGDSWTYNVDEAYVWNNAYEALQERDFTQMEGAYIVTRSKP